MTDYAEKILTEIRDSIPGVRVYDGLPPAAVEDRPPLHVIVDIYPPEIVDTALVVPTPLEERVKVGVRVIARTGGAISREDAAFGARWHSRQIRDHLLRTSVTPGKGPFLLESGAAYADEQALVSHAYRIEAQNFTVRI